MSTTNSRKYKMKYIVIIIVILLILIATICYFTFFRGEGSKPSDITYTTDEQSSNNTTIESDNINEEANQKNKKYINLGSKSVNEAKKSSEENFKNFENSYIPALFEKQFRYNSEVLEIYILIEIKLYDALETFLKTDVKSAIKSLEIREEENHYIQTPDCPGVLITSILFDSFDKTIKTIYEKYKNEVNLSHKQMDLEFLDLSKINSIFEDGDIKTPISLEYFKNVKNPLFIDVPISILIDLEINLLKIKRSILKYSCGIVDRLMENTLLLHAEMQKIRGYEMDDKLKKTILQYNYESLNEDDLKELIDVKYNLLKDVDEALNENIESLKKLNKLNDFMLGKAKISE